MPFAVVAALTVVAQRPGLGGPLPLPAQRRWLKLAARLLPQPRGTIVRQVDLGGRPALRITVGASQSRRAIVHLHGGAYLVGSPKTHRSLAAFLAEAAGVAVYLPDYRLAPENRYPAALDDAIAACVEVAATHDQFAISGDSAGGGLAVAATRRLVDAGRPAPAAMGLISPWVDPLAKALGKKRDLVIREKWGTASAAAYLGGGDPNDPGFAPALGNLAGLPPTLLQVGRTELLHGQDIRFARALEQAGVEVTVTELPRLWHVGHAQAGLLAEAHDAVVELGEFLRKALYQD